MFLPYYFTHHLFEIPRRDRERLTFNFQNDAAFYDSESLLFLNLRTFVKPLTGSCHDGKKIVKP